MPPNLSLRLAISEIRTITPAVTNSLVKINAISVGSCNTDNVNLAVLRAQDK